MISYLLLLIIILNYVCIVICICMIIIEKERGEIIIIYPIIEPTTCVVFCVCERTTGKPTEVVRRQQHIHSQSIVNTFILRLCNVTYEFDLSCHSYVYSSWTLSTLFSQYIRVSYCQHTYISKLLTFYISCIYWNYWCLFDSKPIRIHLNHLSQFSNVILDCVNT